MCKFFSCLSDDKGNVYFLEPQKVVEIMCSGNKESYDFNSHSSAAKILGLNEDELDKWEYNPEQHTIRLDSGTNKFKVIVLDKLKAWFYGKDILYLRNLYGSNAGNRNSGNWNSGDSNSGCSNSGNRNSGNRNSGNGNSGDMNSGDMNSVDRNSGDWNSGNSNSGNRNSGDSNSGNRNSGDWNSGDSNSGNRNSGDMNSGNWNSGNCNSGTTQASFCSHKVYYLFNEKVTEKEYLSANIFIDLPVCEWISELDMTDKEKTNFPLYKTCGGFLRTLEYKEAWKRVSQEYIDRIKKFPKFNKKIFEEITGLREV